MADPVPRRPAALPAALFLAVSAWPHCDLAPWTLAVCVAAGVLLAARPHRDRGAIAVALCAGLFQVAWTAGPDGAGAGPNSEPVERSWRATLTAAPVPREPGRWTLRTRLEPEGSAAGRETVEARLEVPVRTRSDVRLLKGWNAGDRFVVWARLHRFDAARGALGAVKSLRLVEPTGERESGFLLQRRRDACVRRVWTIYGDDPPLAGFFAAVLFGERGFGDEQAEARLRAAGLSHLLAISGLHVGIAIAALGALGLSRCAPRAFVLSLGGALIAFGFLTGWAIPVRRAVGAAALSLAGRAIGRDGDALNRLALLAAVLAWPLGAWWARPAFTLSFVATAGILAVAGEAADRPSLALRAVLGAYGATAGLSAFYFGQVAPWAPVANLLALPFVATTLVAGYLSVALEGTPCAGFATEWVARRAHLGLEGVAEVIDSLPASPWYVAPPPPGGMFLLFVSGAAATFAASRRARRIAGLAFALSLTAVHLGPPPSRPHPPRAELLDVGQGQSFVWSAGDGLTVVDAGGRSYGRWDPGARVVRPALLERGNRRIERLVISHGDADHAGGAAALADGLEIGELWVGPGWWRDARLAGVAAHARSRGAAVRIVWRGHAEGTVRVLWPPRGDSTGPRNGRSLVLRLGAPPADVTVPGDLDGAALGRALEEGAFEPSAALVLSHHGSRRGTSSALLHRVHPEVALVSCGRRNRFGHPHPETLQALRAAGIRLRRTDREGTLVLRANPGGWSVATRPRTSPGTR